jgi:hypothetical protein
VKGNEQSVALVDFCTIGNAKIPIIRPALAACRVKNHLTGDFWDFMREAQQTAKDMWHSQTAK